MCTYLSLCTAMINFSVTNDIILTTIDKERCVERTFEQKQYSTILKGTCGQFQDSVIAVRLEYPFPQNFSLHMR